MVKFQGTYWYAATGVLVGIDKPMLLAAFLALTMSVPDTSFVTESNRNISVQSDLRVHNKRPSFSQLEERIPFDIPRSWTMS